MESGEPSRSGICCRDDSSGGGLGRWRDCFLFGDGDSERVLERDGIGRPFEICFMAARGGRASVGRPAEPSGIFASEVAGISLPRFAFCIRDFAAALAPVPLPLSTLSTPFRRCPDSFPGLVVLSSFRTLNGLARLIRHFVESLLQFLSSSSPFAKLRLHCDC